jgi:hypothetical protein
MIPLRQRWQEERQDIELRSVFGSQILQPVPPVWATELEFDDRADWLAGDIKALWMQLAGGNQLEVYDSARPAPLGTYRGTLSLAADVAQGATSMQLKRVTDNLVLFPEDFSALGSAGGWNKSASGLGSNPTVVVNDAVAPDGTMTADRVTFNLNGGTTSTDQSNLSTNAVTVVGQPTVGAIWAKTADGSTVTVRVDYNGSGTPTPLFTVTPTWQFLQPGRLAGASVTDTNRRFFVRLRGGLGTSNSAVLHLWGGKQINADVLTDYGFGLTLLQGDWLGIGSGSKQQVVMVTQDATSTGQGNITVNFEHPLRNGFSAGQAVTWDKPKALFRLRQNRPGWDYERSRAKNLKFDLVESVYP